MITIQLLAGKSIIRKALILLKEKSVTLEGMDAKGKEMPARKPEDLGNEILELMALRTENPSEAFVLLQQLCIYLWDTYKIDWEAKDNSPVNPDRKMRYLSFVAGLVDHLTKAEPSSEEQPQA
jgi:hypothetical protein